MENFWSLCLASFSLASAAVDRSQRLSASSRKSPTVLQSANASIAVIPVAREGLPREVEERTRLIRTAREVNDAKPKFVVAQIRERAERFKRPVIACLGLTYKPDVDDLRESPAIEIAIELARAGREQILIADPNLTALPGELAALSNVSLCDTLEAVRHADIVALLVAHSRFRKIPREEWLGRVVIDVTGLTHGSG